ncbi:MAG: 5'/3'-nucleotidase SurE [Clostridia bacterium]|nr:5'/3'-nucleotidase SurE [Clostridia bacterium]
MKILIANDDGILAPGLAALVRAFSGAGHEVIVCAPDAQRSAASHSMSFSPIAVKETALDGAARAYAIGGTPVDCVKLGVWKLCRDVDYVVSGINKGYNCGTDILYSGTVGAAREAAMFGYPAMAVSLAAEREDLYDHAAQMALEMFNKQLEHPLPAYAVLNLNYPAQEVPEGIVCVPMAKRSHYIENYVRREEAGGVYYVIDGYPDPHAPENADDWTMLRRGYATVTVLGHDLTDYGATDAFGRYL